MERLLPIPFPCQWPLRCFGELLVPPSDNGTSCGRAFSGYKTLSYSDHQQQHYLGWTDVTRTSSMSNAVCVTAFFAAKHQWRPHHRRFNCGWLNPVDSWRQRRLTQIGVWAWTRAARARLFCTRRAGLVEAGPSPEELLGAQTSHPVWPPWLPAWCSDQVSSE